MQTSSKACLALAAVLLAGGAPSAGAQEKKLPNVVIWSPAGQCERRRRGTQSGYTSGAVTIDAMPGRPASRTWLT
jgi:hypothetical protein